ncbi:MAG: restriction endonuclease, partial [Gammaproteobacteria bacterium]|nr:restriction endonuclease [Gammaproteobacteria bacterium]
WFIDFDPVRAKAEGRPTGLSKEISDLFPDSFEDSELGEIPKGWRIESFSNITSFKNGFAFKSKDWTESGKPVVKIGNVKPLILDIDGCSFISDDIKKYDEYLLSKGDILIGMTGYVGETCLVPKLDKMPYQNQRVGKLIPTKDFFKEFIFSFTRQSNFKKKVEEIAKGSAQQNVSGKDILGLHFVFGNEEILKIFSDSTSDLFKKILLNFEENITLAKVRDTLLPKLISGELKILDAENLIEEAGI